MRRLASLLLCGAGLSWAAPAAAQPRAPVPQESGAGLEQRAVCWGDEVHGSTTSSVAAWRAARAAPSRKGLERRAVEPIGVLGSVRVLAEPKERYLGLYDSARSVPLESLGLIALITYTGFKDWNWGSASFRFQSERWFGMSTGSGGLDKVGHAYANYIASELLFWRLRSRHDADRVVSLYPALFVTLLYQYIEIFDGYSIDHGYAYEDVIMNAAGASLSLLRNAVPRLGKLLDFRLEYYPSGGRTFQPMIDYDGQKFFAVLKLSGIPGVERTLARYFELLGGYYTRGFPRYAKAEERSKHYVIGVGLSLSELILGPLERAQGQPFSFLNLASNYFQAPLYLSSERVRTRPSR